CFYCQLSQAWNQSALTLLEHSIDSIDHQWFRSDHPCVSIPNSTRVADDVAFFRSGCQVHRSRNRNLCNQRRSIRFGGDSAEYGSRRPHYELAAVSFSPGGAPGCGVSELLATSMEP